MDFNAMTVVEWIAPASSLTDLGTQWCKISGPVSWEDNRHGSYYAHVVMQSFGSSLRSLKPKQSLARETVSGLETLKYLDFYHLTPSIVNLRILYGLFWLYADTDADEFFDVLTSLPSLRVLAVNYMCFPSGHVIEMPTNGAYQYLQKTGPILTRLLLNYKAMSIYIFETVASRCPELTHLVIDFEKFTGQEVFEVDIGMYARTCPKLRKIGFKGDFDEGANGRIRRLTGDLNVSRSIGVYNMGYDELCAEWGHN
ncbi:hypothetical protein HK097_010982 [Rhizophlyctis rosea]|uniref:Uncharacterized protein n=1 Tax=Rhizophlyctis rosea TaxID=64517 RepID=A0AAD5X2R3_9FUNG|nr:hypothetical protein HK097_010982 [Rhizophlyctis rosea]